MLHDKNWLSYDFYNWIDAKKYDECSYMHSRCSFNLIAEAIRKIPNVVLAGIRYYPEGSYQEEGKPLLDNLPAFYEVHIVEMIRGGHVGDIKVYLPVRWNGDFMGIAGAGTNLRVDWCIVQTANMTSWPISLRNGYACATNNGGTGDILDVSWGFKKDGSPDWDYIDYWAFEGTHIMTRVGKAVTEAVYHRKIRHSYMHGTSGGARQVLTEAQRYPEDYDGLWADGPGYDIYDLMFSLIWAPVVMNNEKHRVPVEKFQAVYELTRNMNRCISGGPFDLKSAGWIQFVRSLPGLETPAGPITPEDIRVMLRIWCGPVLADGTRITYGFGPEIAQWPIGERNFGCLRTEEDGSLHLMIIAGQCLRWIAGDPDFDPGKLTYEEFDALYHAHKKEFERYRFDLPDIRAFTDRGGKLMITHGTGDPIVPVQMTCDYYREVLKFYPSEKTLNESLRVYFPQHAGHALYDWTGPNVTNASGMRNLVDWVEWGTPPESVDTLAYDFEKDEEVSRSCTYTFSMWQWKKHYGR